MSAVILKMAAAQDDSNPNVLPITFEDFWKLYPRKIARKPALKAWLKVRPTHYPLIMENLKKRSWPERQFIPYPATYLNQERWTDEEEETADLGQCCWNMYNNRTPGAGRCESRAEIEKNSRAYCRMHGKMVN